MGSMASRQGDRGGPLAALALLGLVLYLAGPHTAAALDRAGIGDRLRQAVRHLPANRRLHLPHPGAAPSEGASRVARRAVAYALAQRGKPYRWGATGPASFDCSGLAVAAYQAAGIRLPRTAAAQYRAGGRGVTGQLLAGDLVFYRSSGPSGWHEAIYTGSGRMVEAPSSGAVVRLTALRRAGYLGAVRPAPLRDGGR
jgi:cell wall-associated NlpC family hydrolase